MIRDFFLALVSFFVVEPVSAELDRLARMTAVPPAIVEEARRCVTASGPALVDRLTAEPVAVVLDLAAVAIGMTEATAVLAETVPSCAGVLEQAKPFLEGADAA